MKLEPRLDSSYWALRVGLGATATVAGADKFLNLLTNWEQYVSPVFAKLLPFSPATFMHVVGIIEIAVGLAILTGLTRLGAYVASAWLLGIAVNLVSSGRFFDIAARDVVMSIAAFSLARLAEVRAGAVEERRVHRAELHAPAASQA